MTSQEEFNKIASGMDEVNNKMYEEEVRIAPRCHFRPMFRDMSDSTDGYYEEWWECSVCGHTKAI
jgi:hypothetical protein